VKSLSLALIRQRYAADGGAERFVARTLEALKGHDVKLTLIAREWRKVDGVDVVVINPFYLGRLWRDWSFARAVRKFLEQQRFDIVQSHERIPGSYLYRAGDGVHAEWLLQRAHTLSGWRRLLQALNPYHAYVKRAERRMFTDKNLRAVICNSNMVKREVTRWFGVSGDKLHVIPNGVNANEFNPELRRYRHDVRMHHGIPDDAPVFLFVGSGFERKGVSALLKALAKAPRAFLLVVGRDKKSARYMHEARRLGLGGRVVFAGSAPDIKRYYGAADAFVLPTLYDPFPNVVLEAMASGLPVVISDKCGAMDVVENGRNGYVFPVEDIERLTAAMQSLTDMTRAAEMGKAARAAVVPLSVERTVEQLSTLYARLANSRTDV
jgi:UDP-glucose:(heptosyl)LPS alpha-1,3-glucosyltransferase